MSWCTDGWVVGGHDCQRTADRVVVPAFNMQRWLAETIRSLQAQSHSTWVCLIVDDGSDDDTAAVAEALAADDERITVHRQANGGVSAARNAGTALLPTDIELISYLDSDDLLLPDAFADLSAALLTRPDAVGSATGARLSATGCAASTRAPMSPSPSWS